MIFIGLLSIIALANFPKLCFAENERLINKNEHITDKKLPIYNIMKEKIGGRVTVSGRILRFQLGDKTAEAMYHQIGDGNFFEGLVCLKHSHKEKRLDNNSSLYECWLSISLKKGILVEADDTNICGVTDIQDSDILYWDEIGNKTPRSPDLVDYEDIRNDAGFAFKMKTASGYDDTIRKAKKQPGFDLVLAKPEGTVTISDRTAFFCLSGVTAEAMYYQLAEEKKFEGLSCQKNSNIDNNSIQYTCQVGVNLKKGAIVNYFDSASCLK